MLQMSREGAAKPTKDNPFRLGMGEWTESDDSESNSIEAAEGLCLAPRNKKKLKLSLSKRREAAAGKENRENSVRFEFMDEAKVEALSKKFVPKNTTTSTKWCVSTFNSWLRARNARETEENRVPMDLLQSNDAALINKWLTLYVAEVRKKDGSQYPPKTVYTLLTGLLRHMRSINPRCPNFLDTSDVDFAPFHNALDNILRELRSKGIGADSRQTEAFTTGDEDLLWESGVLG